jgi:hypothetical protein
VTPQCTGDVVSDVSLRKVARIELGSTLRWTGALTTNYATPTYVTVRKKMFDISGVYKERSSRACLYGYGQLGGITYKYIHQNRL